MRRVAVYILSLFFVSTTIIAQEINTTFGKNRVQYNDDMDTWRRYETNNFITYWYGKSKYAGISAFQIAEKEFLDIQDLFQHRINEKIKLFVYTSLEDIYQTNIGYESFESISAEQLLLENDKVYVYFNGNHTAFRSAIREGIAKVMLNAVLNGESINSTFRQAFVEVIPNWYRDGLIEYASDGWTDHDEAVLKETIASSTKSINKRFKKAPERFGKAFWHYMNESYGRRVISNILYLTRIHKNIDLAFLYALGIDSKEVHEEFISFVDTNYRPLVFDIKPEIIEKGKMNTSFNSLVASPDGSRLAYVSNRKGRWRINIYDNDSKKIKCLFTHGVSTSFRSYNETYPVLFWSPDSKLLGAIYSKKDVLQLKFWDITSGKIDYENTLNPIFQSIYSAGFIDDKYLMLNANIDGTSDLFKYNINTRLENAITSDNYDDLDAVVVNYMGKKGVLFSSNRINDQLNTLKIDSVQFSENYDIYFYDLGSKVLKNLTNTPFISETLSNINEHKLTYLTDAFGIPTIESTSLDKEEEKHRFQNQTKIEDYATVGAKVYITYLKGKRPYLSSIYLANSVPIYSELKKKNLKKNSEKLLQIESKVKNVEDLDGVPEVWFFNSKYKSTKKSISVDKKDNPNKEMYLRYEERRMFVDRLRFRSFGLKMNFNNDLLFGGLNSFSQLNSSYNAIPMGILVSQKYSDLFENYILEGGIRIAANLTSYEAFVKFEDRRKQWDHFYGIYYRTRNLPKTYEYDLLESQKDYQYTGYYQIRYPFDEYRSLRLGTSMRFDNIYFQSSNVKYWNTNDQPTQRISARLEYVLDKTSLRSMNILHGSRAKVWLEAMNRFELKLDNLSFTLSKAYLVYGGFDLRHYIPFFSKSSLALRLAGGSNFGTESILFYLGGVERALFAEFDQLTETPDKPFAFTNLTPQMRGFKRNIRNGTSFLLSNIELRIPIFRHLFSDQIRYRWLRDFQLIGFIDSGTAWHGASPYDKENPINEGNFNSGDIVKIRVRYFRDPLIMSFGFGVRTKLLGYFAKLDYGWGVETKTILPPRLHLSFGYDF